LIATIVAALVTAFIMGALAQRLRISPIAGYLLAGVLVGPFTPGFVADADLAAELAEIGVILLMFGVGLHFSFRDLLSVRRIAVPGAVAQIAAATALGMGLAWWLGWGSKGRRAKCQQVHLVTAGCAEVGDAVNAAGWARVCKRRILERICPQTTGQGIAPTTAGKCVVEIAAYERVAALGASEVKRLRRRNFSHVHVPPLD
jgi:hypothetical protein